VVGTTFDALLEEAVCTITAAVTGDVIVRIALMSWTAIHHHIPTSQQFSRQPYGIIQPRYQRGSLQHLNRCL